MPQLRTVLDSRKILADHLIRPIQDGKPELGWSGDPNLVLAFEKIEQRWELWHMGDRSDQDYMIARGPIGGEINEDAINLLIMALVAGDTHRSGNSHTDQLERMIERNERRHRDNMNKAAEENANRV